MAWYERATARGDYAPRVLATIADLLDGCRSVLDVGAGFGALAVPLARRVERLTALEPSPAMAAALGRQVARAGLRNVTVVPAPWGAVPVPAHDLVLCAHVGPLLRPDSAFVRDVGDVARRGVVLVHDAGGGDEKFFFPELYPALLGRPYVREHDDGALLRALRARGLDPRLAVIEYRSDQPFATLDEACEFWMTYMALEGADVRRFLRRFLARRLVVVTGGWLAPFRKRACVLAWRV